MKILLLINKFERELPVMLNIKANILKLRPNAQVFILDVHEPQYVFRILELSPDVIFTFPFTAIPLSQPILILKYLLGCFVICYRTEGAINLSSPAQLKWLAGMDKYGSNLVDHEIFWGPRTANIVGKELISQNKLTGMTRVHSLGFPPYEKYLNTCESSDVKRIYSGILSKINLYPKEKILFFITGFHLADYSAEDLIRAGDCFDPSAPDAGEQFNMALSGASKAKRFRQLWIDHIMEATYMHPDMLFIVKCHPIERIIQKNKNSDPYSIFAGRNNILYINEGISVAELIPISSLFFHYGSTCVAESYLQKTPSVFVTSYNLYGEGDNASKSAHYYSDMGWPSSRTSDITEINTIITEHNTSPITFTLLPEMNRILYDVFNIKPSHIEGQETYTPARDIARFILDLENDAALSIGESDPFLHDALATHQQTAVKILEYFLSRGQEAYSMKEYASALTYFGKMFRLSKVIGVALFGIHYACALCHINLGNSLLAENELLCEININPSHEEALQKLQKLQDAHANPIKNDN